MIVTGIFLLFAAVPLVSVAEDTTSAVPDECMKISLESFGAVNCQTSLTTMLGEWCSTIFSRRKEKGGWLGTVGKSGCKVCCVFKNENNTQFYQITKAPRSLPCGNGKFCKDGSCP
uniref:Putative ixostatin n=1 Tax=Ixodes ricinus TaxID=34613 RepID=A0A0K8RK64_IXORI